VIYEVILSYIIVLHCLPSCI